MQKSVTQTIIDNWLDELTKKEVPVDVIRLLRSLAEENKLHDPKELDKVISIMEGISDKSKDN